MFSFAKVRKKSIFLVLLLALSVFLASITFIPRRDSIQASGVPEKKGKTIILDAGHGGEDCGAIGVNGVYEKDLNLLIATALGEQLSGMGYEVLYTRTEDRLLYNEEENIKGLRKIYDLKNRVKFAQDYEDSIFISIHMNAFSEEKYSGLQVFYSENHPQSYALANAIQNQVREKLQKSNHRSVKQGSGLYLMENLTCPAVLIECGFLSNKGECEKLCEKEYQKQLSFSIMCGIISVIEDSATEGMKI